MVLPSSLAACLALLLVLQRRGACLQMFCQDFRPCLFPGQLPPTVSNEALRNISEALLQQDAHNAARHLLLNYQSRVRPHSLADEAPEPLIKVRANIFNIPTVAKVHKMFDNFMADSAKNENYTRQDINEENDLLRNVVNTNVMLITFDFLAANGIINRDKNDFLSLLIQIWFLKYSRTKDNYGSCAFEHIFLAELTNGKIEGMHNWIFFSSQEANKTADYMGYIKKVDLGRKGVILKLRYKWSDVVKPAGFMFVGTSPELEMALYTICFLTRPDQPCHLSLGSQNVTIRTRSVFYMNTKYMGSASLRI